MEPPTFNLGYYTTPYPEITFKPKDLVMIPFMAALAFQADGWTVRSVIPYLKRSAMPESVSDRFTTSLSYVLHLTKRASYWFDAEAVKKVASDTGGNGTFVGRQGGARDSLMSGGNGTAQRHPYGGGRNRRNGDAWFESLDALIAEYRTQLAHLERVKRDGGALVGEDGELLGLDITSEHLKAAHYAAYPRQLARTLILCSTSERGCCPECGSPWERVLETEYQLDETRPQARRAQELARRAGLTKAHIDAIRALGMNDAGKARQTQSGTDKNTERVKRLATEAKAVLGGYFREYLMRQRKTIGWRPTCHCYDNRYRQEYRLARSARKRYQQNCAGRWFPRVRQRPGQVDWPVTPAKTIDPFVGSGTTMLAARETGRTGIGGDLSAEYLTKIAIPRLERTPFPLALAASPEPEREQWEQMGLEVTGS